MPHLSAHSSEASLTRHKIRPLTQLDPGFKSGRQFGRGSSGAQVRSDRQNNHSSGQKRRRDPVDAGGAGAYGPPSTEKKKEGEELEVKAEKEEKEEVRTVTLHFSPCTYSNSSLRFRFASLRRKENNKWRTRIRPREDGLTMKKQNEDM